MVWRSERGEKRMDKVNEPGAWWRLLLLSPVCKLECPGSGCPAGFEGGGVGVPLTTVAGKLEVPVAAAQRLERLRFCWQLFWRLLLELEHFPGWWLLHIVYTSPVLFSVRGRLEASGVRRRLGLSVSGPRMTRFLGGPCTHWRPCGRPCRLSEYWRLPHLFLSSVICFLTPHSSWDPELTNLKPSCGQLLPSLWKLFFLVSGTISCLLSSSI